MEITGNCVVEVWRKRHECGRTNDKRTIRRRNNVLPLVPESNDIVEIQAPQSTPVCISSSVMTICQGNTKIEINSNCPEWMIRELLNKYVR